MYYTILKNRERVMTEKSWRYATEMEMNNEKMVPFIDPAGHIRRVFGAKYDKPQPKFTALPAGFTRVRAWRERRGADR